MRGSLLLGVLCVGGLSAAFACGLGEDYQDCYGVDYVSCICAGGAAGYAKCSPAGNYDGVSCVCDGTTPGLDAGPKDAGSDASVEAGSSASLSVACSLDAGDGGTIPLEGGTRKYLDTCNSSIECETCLCQTFGAAGRCTKPCTTLSECPAPSDACTNRGVCRPPP